MKKRILYIITKSNFGGAQRYVLELATALPKDHYEVAVACGGDGLLTEKIRKKGIPVFPIPSFDRDINFRKELTSIPEIWNIFKKFNPDVVHLNSSKAGGTGALLARLYGVPNIIFTAHGWPFFEKHTFLWRSVVWLLSWVTALLAHKIILVSEHDKKHTCMPFVSRKLEIIYPSVPSIDFKSRDDAREKLFNETIRTTHANDTWLVSVAELTHNKNILAAIRAVEMYNSKSPVTKIFYSIIGDGELRTEYETYIKEHNLSDSIHMLGYVDNARAYLKAFNSFILPSFKEGFPYALLEAGSAELSVIASNVGGIPELITHQKTGFLIDPRNITSITQAFEDLFREIPRDLPVTQIFGQALKEKVTTQFSFEKMLSKTISIYIA